ncbi:glycoside hydrolase [Puteibacter caeruleilacunae]|nr:glycoside hydrolase [Puteibacter caeruleilacunae]
MKHGISGLSTIPVRDEPREKSEMTTQILFGEHFEILEETPKWCRIRQAYDSYEGWIDQKMVTYISEEEFNTLENHDPFVTSDIFNIVQLDGDYNNSLIVAGSSLPFLNKETGEFKLGGQTYRLQSQHLGNNHDNKRAMMIENALKFFNSPYLWGGKTPLGIDCSGFTQVIYKIAGIKIPRDASQQVNVGEPITFVEEAKPGDLAFFDNDDGKITHVGIIWDKHKIIHSSGKVRIDNVDHSGIYNIDTKRYTHRLRVIKRIIP